jgi:hypothetical protein
MHSSSSGGSAICIRSADALAYKCFGAPDRMVIRNLASVGIVAGLVLMTCKRCCDRRALTPSHRA